MKIHADLTLPASCNIYQLDWEDSPSKGVQRRRIECDDDTPPIERVTTVVRFAAGSAFSGHVHGGGEEFLVLEGTFSDQHADYPAGYYVRNPVGTGHAPHSDEGCTILVKLWQMQADDQTQLAIDTRDQALWQTQADNSHILPLFKADYESVCMLKWPTGLRIKHTFEAGVEYFILQGRFEDNNKEYTAGSWLRLPPGSTQQLEVIEDCLLLRKTGHLLNPVPYSSR